MEDFQIVSPTAPLAPYVKHYWLLRSDDVDQTQRVIPSGNIELLFHRAAPMERKGALIPTTSLSGQSFSFADLVPTGKVQMIAVVFHPFGAKAFFDLPIVELSNTIVSAEELSIPSLKVLEDQILNSPDDRQCILLIEAFLLDRLRPLKDYNYQRMHGAIEAINQSDGALSVAQLAEQVCLSKKQFERVFCEHVGARPKEFMRVVRFHKALHTLSLHPLMSFTQLAYACGYYDQAHLIHEFKLFSGYTPSQYVAICSPHSDYFS